MTADSAWTAFVAVALAHALGVASPGPDFAIIVRQSLAHGRASGVWTAAGIGCGILFHVGYGLFGLRWLVARVPASLDLITVAGGGFLIWMGVQALRARTMAAPDSDALAGSAPRGHAPRLLPHMTDFLIGLATNVLNPKATLFFVALFTVVISDPLPATLAWALALWLPLMTFAWFASISLLLSHAGLRTQLRRHAHQIDRAMGVVLILLGGWALVELAARRLAS